MDICGPYVLIGTGVKGEVVEVGLFDDETAMRLHAHRNTREGCRYSVWTPQMNEVIGAAHAIGLSLPRSWSR